MTKPRDFGVAQILVGLDRVGIVGLGKALEKAARSGLTDRNAVVDLLIEALAADNYVADPRSGAYRTALWREYLRSRGEDFSELFSEIDVTVRGEAGEARDAFVRMLRSVLARFELKPVIAHDPPAEEGPNPQLAVHGETIVRGAQSRRSFEQAVRKSVSGW